jgi:uncharacterized protein YodC (DUF2158 family)
MAEELKAGDVVELKSGGSKMTIESIGMHNQGVTVWCNWFDSPKKSAGFFRRILLKRSA